MLDEPFAGLDAETCHSLGQNLVSLRRSGVAVVCALHEHHLATRFFTRTLVMDAGTLREATPADVAEPAHIIEHPGAPACP